jgi:hypothetical protein
MPIYKTVLSGLLGIGFSLSLIAHEEGSLAHAPMAAHTLPEPYQSIKDLPFDPHGWFVNTDSLGKILLEQQPRVVIEVGSWLGLSTRFIAHHIPVEGKVYAVDTWLGSDEAAHHQDPRLPYLYQLFLSNVKHARLTHKIIPIRMRSLEAAQALDVKADLIYIDAAHDEENVYLDIMAWYPHLTFNGVICGDDWGWESVRKGVIRAASELNRTIYATGNFWRFE